MIALVAAYSKNRVIGFRGKLPWNLEYEKKRFADLTRHNIVVMGRKTFESIGEPLQHRLNIVISTTKQFTGQSLCTVSSFSAAVSLAEQLAYDFASSDFIDDDEDVFYNFDDSIDSSTATTDSVAMGELGRAFSKTSMHSCQPHFPKRNIFFIGGERVYKDALPLCEKLFITEIHKDFLGDAFFPPFNEADFTKVIENQIMYDTVPYSYITYTRRK
ncbi:MAG: dihydrofolate reductase [Treponema sp.]|nr:dihydrofolate reductase [Treponema sp.]